MHSSINRSSISLFLGVCKCASPTKTVRGPNGRIPGPLIKQTWTRNKKLTNIKVNHIERVSDSFFPPLGSNFFQQIENVR